MNSISPSNRFSFHPPEWYETSDDSTGSSGHCTPTTENDLISTRLVATLATPAVVRLVAAQLDTELQSRQGASWLQGLAWALACTVAAVVALVLSIPLWLVPPLVMVLPPLIWGWLTCRVFSFDVLALHASAAERRAIAEAEAAGDAHDIHTVG